MTWYCENPNCDYSTNNRNKINWHHIKPKELNGSNRSFNRVFLCPNCHSNVYIPESSTGNHAIKTENSIIILEWLNSTTGKILKTIDTKGNEIYSKMKNN
ncbi:MAG: HNH endonuclease signature motif containing protein [Candidatus Nanoarchaeia archaeon]|nr:HNH endonuclease signature motif containing protein [Candidatus Nanoarchaeia archaeon]